MNSTILLADFAQVADGKLYILGGGWSVARFAGPAQMALAIRVLVPWDQANERHALKLDLRRQDGQHFLIDDQPIELGGEFDVGRPAGVPRGSELDALFAFSVGGFSLPPGSYYWQLFIDDEPAQRASFRILPSN